MKTTKQDPTTLRAIADSLDKEARHAQRRALALFGYAQETTHAGAKADRRESAVRYETEGRFASGLARRLRLRATRIENEARRGS